MLFIKSLYFLVALDTTANICARNPHLFVLSGHSRVVLDHRFLAVRYCFPILFEGGFPNVLDEKSAPSLPVHFPVILGKPYLAVLRHYSRVEAEGFPQDFFRCKVAQLAGLQVMSDERSAWRAYPMLTPAVGGVDVASTSGKLFEGFRFALVTEQGLETKLDKPSGWASEIED